MVNPYADWLLLDIYFRSGNISTRIAEGKWKLLSGNTGHQSTNSSHPATSISTVFIWFPFLSYFLFLFFLFVPSFMRWTLHLRDVAQPNGLNGSWRRWNSIEHRHRRLGPSNRKKKFEKKEDVIHLASLVISSSVVLNMWVMNSISNKFHRSDFDFRSS